MATKVRAAKKVAEYGVSTLILNGTVPDLFHRLRRQAGRQSLSRPQSSVDQQETLDWVSCKPPEGAVTLDTERWRRWFIMAGASWRRAFSMSAGNLKPGDPVSCTNEEGKEFAKGLVNFSAEILTRIKGLKTADIQQLPGLQEYEEVIHRDNLVILD